MARARARVIRAVRTAKNAAYYSRTLIKEHVWRTRVSTFDFPRSPRTFAFSRWTQCAREELDYSMEGSVAAFGRPDAMCMSSASREHFVQKWVLDEEACRTSRVPPNERGRGTCVSTRIHYGDGNSSRWTTNNWQVGLLIVYYFLRIYNLNELVSKILECSRDTKIFDKSISKGLGEILTVFEKHQNISTQKIMYCFFKKKTSWFFLVTFMFIFW